MFNLIKSELLVSSWYQLFTSVLTLKALWIPSPANELNQQQLNVIVPSYLRYVGLIYEDVKIRISDYTRKLDEEWFWPMNQAPANDVANSRQKLSRRQKPWPHV